MHAPMSNKLFLATEYYSCRPAPQTNPILRLALDRPVLASPTHAPTGLNVTLFGSTSAHIRCDLYTHNVHITSKPAKSGGGGGHALWALDGFGGGLGGHGLGGRDQLPELLERVGPVREYLGALFGACEVHVVLDQLPQVLLTRCRVHPLHCHNLAIHLLRARRETSAIAILPGPSKCLNLVSYRSHTCRHNGWQTNGNVECAASLLSGT